MPTDINSQHIITEGDDSKMLKNPPGDTSKGDVSDVLDKTIKTFSIIDITSHNLPKIKVPFRKIAHTGTPNVDDLFDLDFTKSTQESTKDEPIQIPNEAVKDASVLINKLEEIKDTLEGVLPKFLRSKERGDVMADIATQEANWDKIKLEEVVVKGKEISMWSELLSSAKKSDFIPQKTVTTLEKGEILELVIKGFESFRIVKIRTMDKDGYSISVIEFTVEDPKNKDPRHKKYITVKGSYVMRLPLVQGGVISLLNTKMECIASHEIRQIFLNQQQGSILKGFFNLLS